MFTIFILFTRFIRGETGERDVCLLVAIVQIDSSIDRETANRLVSERTTLTERTNEPFAFQAFHIHDFDPFQIMSVVFLSIVKDFELIGRLNRRWNADLEHIGVTRSERIVVTQAVLQENIVARVLSFAKAKINIRIGPTRAQRKQTLR